MNQCVCELLAVILQEKVIKIVELAMIPNVGEVSRCADVVTLMKVLVVVFFGFVRLAQEAKPYGPFVYEEMFLKHTM
jgi:hypothetical protein